MKDWTGNHSALFANLGASNHTEQQREVNDYYATNPKAISRLLRQKKLPHVIYECACGEGHLSEELKKHGHEVISTDLIDRGYGTGGIDFLKVSKLKKDCACILTNPPYKFTLEFIEHSLELLPECGEAIFLLNVNNLAGKTRYERLYSKGCLKEVFLFPDRIACAKNGDFASVSSSAVNYAGFVFAKGYSGTTRLHWIE